MPVPQTPSTVDAGPAGSFKWRGLNWATRSGGVGSPGVAAWAPGNVVSNSDGSLTFRLNASGGCEIHSTRSGFGYGDYWIVCDTPLNNMGHGVTWGSLFTYDNGETTGSHNEIDVQETGSWGGTAAPSTVPHHWGAGTEDLQYGSGFPAPAGPMCSHMRWEPGKISYWTYAGKDDSGALIKSTVTADRVPTPRQEKLIINLWQFKGAIQPIDVKVSNFSFVPRGTTPTPTVDPLVVPTGGSLADVIKAHNALVKKVTGA